MITSSGPRCDVCGDYILPIGDEMVNSFSCKGFDQNLHCHNKCKTDVLNVKNDWTKLPDGPLKDCFKNHYETRAKANR